MKGLDTANFNAVNNKGDTPLLIAAMKAKDISTFNYLVSHGAKLKYETKDGTNVMLKAALHGNLVGIRFALGRGIDINCTNIYGNTPLLLAVINYSNLTLFEELLKLGASLTCKSLKGHTILHHSVRGSNCSASAVKYALSKGFQIGEKDADGKTALTIALERGDSLQDKTNIIPLLQSRMKKEAKFCEWCVERKALVEFKPCGHRYSCEKCSKLICKCKSCNVTIVSKIDIITNSELVTEDTNNNSEYEVAMNAVLEELSLLSIQKEAMVEQWKKVKSALVQSVEDLKLCPICMDTPKTIAFNCGHVVCEPCGRMATLCQFCRLPVTSRLKLYQ